jgi:hypothetical protein
MNSLKKQKQNANSDKKDSITLFKNTIIHILKFNSSITKRQPTNSPFLKEKRFLMSKVYREKLSFHRHQQFNKLKRSLQ